MDCTMEQYRSSAQAIRERLGDFTPKAAMVLGSGLGALGDEVENPILIDYRDIPYFKASTAPGHKGRLVFGELEGQKVAVMQGRMHHYEGYSYEEGRGADAHYRPDQNGLRVPSPGGKFA